MAVFFVLTTTGVPADAFAEPFTGTLAADFFSVAAGALDFCTGMAGAPD
jgi:hypothetical protein